MTNIIFPVLSLVIGIAILTSAQRQGQGAVQIGVGDFCAPGGAPIGPGGSFQVIPNQSRKICPRGTSCRNGACNCNNYPDGSVTGISVDSRGNRSCRKVAGQRCRYDGECFDGVRCIRGFCTCNPNSRDYCVDRKNDVFIQI